MNKKNSTTALFIIPVFSATGNSRLQRHLADAIASIEAQTDHDWHIALVDDASSSAEFSQYLTDLAQAHSDRVTLIKNPKNSGPGISRNLAIAWAAEGGYPFVLFNDADDLSHPKRLEMVRKLFSVEETVSVVYSSIIVIDEQGSLVPEERIPPSVRDIIESANNNPPTGNNAWIKIVTEKNGYVNLTSATAVRTNLAKRCPFPAERISEDAATWLKYSALGGKYAFISDIPSLYRINVEQQTISTQAREGGKQHFFSEVVRNNSSAVKECIEIALRNNTLAPEDTSRILVQFYVNLATMLSGEKQYGLCRQLLDLSFALSKSQTTQYLKLKNLTNKFWAKDPQASQLSHTG